MNKIFCLHAYSVSLVQFKDIIHLWWYHILPINSDRSATDLPEAHDNIQNYLVPLPHKVFHGQQNSLSTQNLCMRQLILAKPLSNCGTVLCHGQSKSIHLKVCGILKRTCYIQIECLTLLTGTFVVCAVADAGPACCCFLASSAPTPTPHPPNTHFIGEPPFQPK